MKSVLRKLPWILLGTLLLAMLGYGFRPKPIPVAVVTPVRGSLSVTVDDDGETRIRERYSVAAPVNGDLQRIELHAGDPVVRETTVLAQIEPAHPELLDARMRAEAEARVQAKAAQLDQAGAAVTRAIEVFELADHEYNRARQAIQRDTISRAEFDEAEHHQRVAAADLRSAEFVKRVAMFELDLAKVALEQFEQPDSEEPQPKMNLVSPTDGVLLNVFREDAGFVTAGTALVEVGDPQNMEIRVDVLSTDAVRIQPGNKVLIEHWGGDHVLTGRVRRVEPAAFLKISALGVEEKRVKVIVDFDEPWNKRQSLGDGYRVEARIVVASTAADSLKVPAGVLFRENDEWSVFRVVGGRAQLTRVTVGQSNGLETELLSGVSIEDELILHPSDKINSNARVAPSP